MAKSETTKGYIQEIFSSFQGEGTATVGSCYGLRQIFVRFAGCPLNCIWCDSPQAKTIQIETCRVEKKAGSQTFNKIPNPITAQKVIENIRELHTKDLHSVSLTGGEPLHQPKLLEELLLLLKRDNYRTYLETAFINNLEYLENIAKFIDFACVDIKDRSAKSLENWNKLVETEIEMCKILKRYNSKVFAKVVISQNSNRDDFKLIAKECGKNNIPLNVQILTPPKDSTISSPKWNKIIEFTELAGEYLPPDKIGVSVQVHKLINIL